MAIKKKCPKCGKKLVRHKCQSYSDIDNNGIRMNCECGYSGTCLNRLKGKPLVNGSLHYGKNNPVGKTNTEDKNGK